MLTPGQVGRFAADGFLKGPRILTGAQVDELRGELERVIRDHGKGDRQPVSLRDIGKGTGSVWQIVNIWEASDAFAALVRNPVIADELAQLTGSRELRVWHDQVQYKPAGTGGVNMWHQDWPYWGILDGPTQVTAWVALDEVAEDNGCMSMVPGSQKWGNQQAFLHSLPDFQAMPDRYGNDAVRVVTCPVGKGEVHYHHAMTWHGSHANTSGRPRRAVAIHVMTGATRYRAAGEHLMKRFVTVPDGAPISGDHFPLLAVP